MISSILIVILFLFYFIWTLFQLSTHQVVGIAHSLIELRKVGCLALLLSIFAFLFTASDERALRPVVIVHHEVLDRVSGVVVVVEPLSSLPDAAAVLIVAKRGVNGVFILQ